MYKFCYAKSYHSPIRMSIVKLKQYENNFFFVITNQKRRIQILFILFE